MKKIHIRTDKYLMVCDPEKEFIDYDNATYYSLDDIAENGKDAVVKAANMFYMDCEPCPKCFSDENLNLYLLARY